MAVGDVTFPTMHPVAGFALGTTEAGVRYPDRRDLVVMECAAGSTIGAVFTQNAFCAAPVSLCKAHLAQHAPCYMVTNTGNANAGTGPQGQRDAEAVCGALAQLTQVQPTEILPFSTGVIGEPLPLEPIIQGLPDAIASLSEMGWEDAANGIMTTDTVIKGASQQLEVGGRSVTITGIAKGSGMIHPDMATMLAYIATDAVIEQDLLQEMVSYVVGRSFNRVTVDGDTSTNDSFVVVATGQNGMPPLTDGDSEVAGQFVVALEAVALELAQLMVRDGEGASKFVTVTVEGATVEQEALDVALTIAHSPLVKTALFASDPNWGRILAAVGRAKVEKLDVNRVSVWLDDVAIVENGGRASSYTEEQGQMVMDRAEITIRIDLARGEATETVWTCDLSHDYVKINAEYRS
ncbi:MAG: bifunctional glutamate N-acetyltransferase/amino-acid acetyltransferase ArgJ [Gammaproteobacteria bacterium]|jgi:glutamate N-acetyltransferase/amino-acid N-acetyltransferase|nr:bifunctional glutamate N-acetyltransferase/amino-acid acetyltransferase ArgJ [Gammaproteobacteria bacterium]MBT4608291.1 bifunctional glutamate N-acetyltransferase/amino-acid acetyltransferase ArgJ [Thiotrichales bacterium]MBT3471722.1 bifunctional glutamate N-acetyltransferase/amino-acid acetyltransferase ArgJ [Gammaproteobacteria bacterium]MBT3966839.1 bifunctional glutamate N-acetyltransferase/amino-acid acetyltransferase ArgJ [Gammaproteobacteria bacterium]MBT4079732.1 bifunctional gluta